MQGAARRRAGGCKPKQDAEHRQIGKKKASMKKLPPVETEASEGPEAGRQCPHQPAGQGVAQAASTNVQ
eukprot:GDKH01002019.1.p1 GENE.GDKH01002019.1~~GDKH01002019.1.p1  ORF type:complete len:69 (+),score=5.59 GDKH01002019.1:103-309(+)